MTADAQYVLDGVALVQRIFWSGGATYKDIFYQYTEYVTRRYGKAIFVFDGLIRYIIYKGHDTQKKTIQRRNIGVTVTFTEDMNFTMKKERFLVNKQNK
jgi:hypothetical protein